MAPGQPLRLILASASWGRRELLRQAGYTFEVVPSSVDEPTGEGVRDIRQFVQHVAWLKAAAVAPRVEAGLVLAADSVGWIDGQVIAKPTDRDDARRILRLLSGAERLISVQQQPAGGRQRSGHQLAAGELARLFGFWSHGGSSL